jgi:hypothetical protein
MTRTLVLHIGLPKTGTTAIQRTLASRRRALAARGICYPVSAGGAVPVFLHRAALAGSVARGRHGQAVARFAESLCSEIAGLPAEMGTVILSAEQCSLHLQTRAQIGQLHALLAPHFTAMRVVIYLRRQDALAASLYAQMLRRGIMELPQLGDPRPPLDGLYDYATLMDNWAWVFGADAMVPRIFARDRLPDGDVVRDFLALCGVDGMQAARARGDVNPSMNAQGQALMLAVGRVMQHQCATQQERSEFSARLAGIVTRLYAGRGWQPSRAAAASFMARYADGNELVRREWFPQQASLFDMDFSVLPEIEVALDTQEVADAACAVIVQLLRETQRDASGSEVDS